MSTIKFNSLKREHASGAEAVAECLRFRFQTLIYHPVRVMLDGEGNAALIHHAGFLNWRVVIHADVPNFGVAFDLSREWTPEREVEVEGFTAVLAFHNRHVAKEAEDTLNFLRA